MKTSLLFSTGLACALLVTRSLAATDVAAGWQAELASLQQTSHQDAGGRARADAILRAALDSTRNGLVARESSGQPAEPAPVGASLDAAAAQASYSVMAALYPQSLSELDTELAKSLAAVDATTSAIAAGRKWGEHVAQVVLAEQSDAVFLNASSFAEDAKTPDASSLVPEVHAEQAVIGTGRYLFSVLAGTPGAKGYVDGIGVAARFGNSGGIAVDSAGDVYVSEIDMNTIRKISSVGVVSTLAGAAGQSGSEDGAGSAARFNKPRGLTVDDAGNVYVADTGNHTIRRIDPIGNVTTVAGTAGAPGVSDGNRTSARFRDPAHVAVDQAGSVFVVENVTNYYWSITGDSTQIPIRKIASDGTVSTLTIQPIDTVIYGAGGSKYLYHATPSQICADRAGNLYVIDTNFWDYSNVVKLTPTGSEGHYTASQVGPPDYDPDSFWPTGISLDEAGGLYIASAMNTLHVRAPDGGWQARSPAGIENTGWLWVEEFAVGQSQELYIAQLGAVKIGVFDPDAKGPVILSQPWDQVCYIGERRSFHISAVGGLGLAYQWYFNSNPISGATSDSLELKNVQAGDAGFYSVVVTDEVGSITSSSAKLVVNERPVSPPASPAAPASGSGGSGSVTSGGGNFDPGISLAVLLLLAVAARRRRRFRRSGDFKIAAYVARDMEMDT